MKLKPGWQKEKNVCCYFCGTTRSVKYEIDLLNVYGDRVLTVDACNKCALLYDHPTEKVCTGKRCPMQVGYDVKNCKDKDCIYRTETEKGGVQE